MIRYSHTTIRKLSSASRTRLYELSFYDGMMRELINENKANVGVVLAWEGTYIIGWSFIDGPCIGCYVDPQYRRQGIGQKLVKLLKTGTRKRFVVSLHNTAARYFYGGMGARVDYVEAAKRPDWILNGVMTK